MAATHILTRDEAQRRAELLRRRVLHRGSRPDGARAGRHLRLAHRRQVLLHRTRCGDLHRDRRRARIEDAYLNGEPVDISAFDPRGRAEDHPASPPRTSWSSTRTSRTPATGRACTASSTRSTSRPTSTRSSRSPTPSACTRASTSRTSRPSSPSRCARLSTGASSPTCPPRSRPSRGDRTKVTHFEQSVRMSPYITAICAGPVLRGARADHDGIDLGPVLPRSP